MPPPWRNRGVAVATVLLVSIGGTPCAAQSTSEIQTLRQELEELRRRDADQQRKLESLQRRLDQIEQNQPSTMAPAVKGAAAPSATPPARAGAAAALDQALEESAPTRPLASAVSSSDLWSRQLGGGKLRLLDVSLSVLTAAGTSTASDDEIGALQGGAHDPQRRGFTLQQAELSLTGAVDPYFNGEAHIVFVPDGVELEEAFLTTSSLPYGLQLEGGHFFTEFGQINPLHPHAWDWIDQPVINSRLFGGDGLRAPGFRLGWLTPLPWFSEVHFGMQNANEGETTVSFINEEGLGGRPAVERGVHSMEDLLYLARWENFVSFSDELGAKLGVSGLYGPNATGSDAETFIYGADWKLRWRPADNFRGWPFFLWQTELMKRDYTASAFDAGTEESPEPIERIILRDWGLYTQGLYGFRYGWAAGIRFEYASGSGASMNSRQSDSLRDDRYRLSPLLAWHPTEFSRLRLQYNYDDARHLSSHDAHSVWLGAEILYGMHPAHKY